MATSILMALNSGIILPTAKAYQPLPGEFGGTYTNTTTYSTTIPSGVTPTWTFSPIAYISVSPPVIGQGQQLLVNVWTTPPSAANRFLQGITVTLTKPDGTTDVIGPLHSYVADGTCWFNYYPDQIGNWSAVFSFPGQYYPAGVYYNGNYNGSVVNGAATYFTTAWNNISFNVLQSSNLSSCELYCTARLCCLMVLSSARQYLLDTTNLYEQP